MIHVNFMTALTFCCNPYCDIIISIVLLAQQCIIIISGIAKVASDYLEKETIVEPVDEKEEFWTPLHWAAHYGHTNLFQVLSEHVENINPVRIEPFDNIGKTPLYYAARRNHKAVCYLIIRIVYENDRTLLQALVRGTHSLTNFLGMQGIIRREEAQTKQQNLLTKPLPTWLGRFG